MQNLNWNSIRPINNSQKEGFEELVCQLAKNDIIENSKSFIRKGSPDAGVECFWILNDDKEICYQAKFFTSPLTSTQWGEIDESIRTALDKHPHIVKYIVSIPQDRADARVKGRKSFLDKWNESVIKWQSWAKDKGIEVEFLYEGSSELFDKLSKPQNIGKLLFWFNKDEYTEQWFYKQNVGKIKDLGARYSPEVNVEISIKYMFDGLYYNSDYKAIVQECIDLQFENFSHLIMISSNYAGFQSEINDIFNKFSRKVIEFDFINSKDIKALKSLFNSTYKLFISKVNDLTDQIDDISDKEIIGRSLNELIFSLQDSVTELSRNDTKLAQFPYLIIEGEAGIGKSHLVADIITENFNKKNYSILLLGQHFYKEDIWTQLKNQLDIRVSKEEFLGMLNSKGESLNSRIVICIDAINEGEGKYLWKDQLLGFLEDIKCFSNIGLIITIRNTYKDIVLPDNTPNELLIVKHNGFSDTLIATKKFFEYYGIQEAPIPILNPEFNNPLFLKLFCIGLRDNGINSIPQDYDNLNTIFSYLIQAANKALSVKLDFDYRDFNLVENAISVLVEKIIKSPSFQISRKEARDLLANNFKYDVDKSRNILTELINENILTENVIYNNSTSRFDKEIVYFSYERLGDYFIVESLLKEDVNKIRESGKIDPKLNIYKFIKDEESRINNLSLIEILSISLPEKTNFELYELIDNNNDYFVGEAFIKSLIWRHSCTIGEKNNNYLLNYILRVPGLNRTFLDVLIQLSIRKGHYLNAYFFNSYLSGMQMNERDFRWTIYIDQSDIAMTFSKWVWESKVILSLDEKTLELVSLTLAWFLTSSNRELRDISTKGLVKILQNNLSLFKRLIVYMECVDDLYIHERLYASGYGAIMRSNEVNQIKKLAEFTFDYVFKDKNPPEHHLLRDYARGILEYAFHLGLINVDMSLVRPPYKSFMPINIPSVAEIIKFKPEGSGHTAQNSLYNLVMGGSDFARYTLGTNHHSNISSITIKSFNVYKKIKSSSKKKQKEIEDIIKMCKNYKSEFIKQEWKDSFKKFYDTLKDIIKFQFKLSENEAVMLHDYIERFSNDYFSKDTRFDLNILQRLIIKDIFETYGWKEEYFENHDYKDLNDGYFNKNTFSKRESIGKKYALISYYKWLSIILDNYLINLDYSSAYSSGFEIYTGTWATGKRDIDPSLLDGYYYKDDIYKNNLVTYWYPENNIEWDDDDYPKWVLKIKDLVHPKDLINIRDEQDTEWLNLYSYPSWYGVDDLNGMRKQIWYHIKSFIVKKKNKGEIIKALKNKSFFNDQIPQEQTVYDVFSREYYWSQAFESCTYENHPENSDRRLHSSVDGKNIIGQQTAMNYAYYENRDFSLAQNIYIKRPTKYLFSLLELHLKENEVEFYNTNDELVLFNPAIKYQEGNDCLLVKKSHLIEQLDKNDMDIIWLVLGAKEVLGSTNIIHEGDINNIFYLNQNMEVNGEFEIKPYIAT